MFSFTSIKQDLVHVSFKLATLQILKWMCSAPKSSLVPLSHCHGLPFTLLLVWRQRKRWNIHTGVYESLYTPLIRKGKQSKVPTWNSWNHLGLLAMSAWEHETNFMTAFQGSGEALWQRVSVVGRWGGGKRAWLGSLPKGEHTSFCSLKIAL